MLRFGTLWFLFVNGSKEVGASVQMPWERFLGKDSMSVQPAILNPDSCNFLKLKTRIPVNGKHFLLCPFVAPSQQLTQCRHTS